MDERKEILDGIGYRVAFVRKSKKLSQKALGELLGLATKTIGSYEYGEREMGLITAMKICKVLDASPMFILFGEDIHMNKMRKLLTAQDNTTFKVSNSGGRLNVTISVPVLPELEGL